MMTRKEAINVLKNEIKCVLRNSCERIECASCELVMPIEQILSAYDMAISALREQEERRWIPVKERLPAESGYYLVAYRDKFSGNKLISIDFYTKCVAGEWWENDFGRTAICWMPLPEPPKEKIK